MRDQHEPFSPTAYLPAVSGYYADAAGNMLSFPFNASTPILYYNKDHVPRRRPRPEAAAEDLAGARCRPRNGCATAGAVCGFTTSWPSWINVENFSGLS